MTFDSALMLMGGIALFLYGMKMMSDGLELIAGNKLQGILEKLTTNRFIGVAVGALITAAIQSSTATTVMVVGFVNSGMMKLTQAVWVIMGANIGTTITGQLVALDAGMIAPLIAFIGVIIATFFKNKRVTYLGQIIAGLGIILIGMDMMSSAMVPLRSNPEFVNLMATISNPVLGILVGIVFTAILQSSSASVGILQSLAQSGLITLHGAAFILFGLNIGTCLTALIAGLSANRNAKRTTLMHLLFNVIGTVLFIVLMQITPIINILISWTPDHPMKQIANLHTIFNVITTIVLLPFGLYLAEFTKILLPVKESEKEERMAMVYFDESKLGTFAIAFASLRQEVSRMFEITKDNLDLTMQALVSRNQLDFERIDKNENMINYLNFEISKYMGRVSGTAMLPEDSVKCNSLFKMSNDIERIGDHTYNLAQYCKLMNENQVSFDEAMAEELKMMFATIRQGVSALTEIDFTVDDDIFHKIEEYEQRIDDLTDQFRQGLIDQLRKEQCDARSCVTYSEILTDLERIGDHIMNLAEECHNAKLSLRIHLPASVE